MRFFNIFAGRSLLKFVALFNRRFPCRGSKPRILRETRRGKNDIFRVYEIYGGKEQPRIYLDRTGIKLLYTSRLSASLLLELAEKCAPRRRRNVGEKMRIGSRAT